MDTKTSPIKQALTAGAIAGLLALGTGAIVTAARSPEPEAPAHRDDRLARLVESCPDARPMLAAALDDDRITVHEADAIENRIDQLVRAAREERLRNHARTAAGTPLRTGGPRCNYGKDLF